MKLTIERDIPIPKCLREGEIDFVSVIDEMRVGDSFKIPIEKRAGAVTAFKRKGLKCVSRSIKDEAGWVRIWRSE